jgi:GTPase SAR1 family protein
MGSTFSRYHEIIITVFGTLGVTALMAYLTSRVRRLVRSHGETIINGVFWILERGLTRSISANLSMKRYCAIQLADETNRYLQVPGSRNLALDVDDVFVPLTLQLGGRDKTFTNSNITDAGSRLLIVGDPGCGKSTLVKRIFRDNCHSTQSRPTKGRLPIRLELKSLTPPPGVSGEHDAGKWMMGILRDNVSKIEGFEMSRLFDSWSVDAGLLVLLDGLDEVSSERYSVVSAGIRGLGQRLAELTPNNAVIVTMRIQFHQQVGREYEENYPQTLYVRPFYPNEIFTFLNRWPFDLVDDKERDGVANRIYNDLTDRPTLREMCSNPLVLAMYVESDYESGGHDAPETRTQFYEKVVAELLIKRRRRQDVARGPSIGLRDQREEILGELALENLLDSNQSANSLSWSKAVFLTRKICAGSESDAIDLLRELARETGLISEERPEESLRFIHLTFCEFFAANQCAKGREDGWKAVLNRHREFINSGELHLQTRLIEVLPFAHALLPRVHRSNALADVASLNDRLVLGRCFLETQLYGQPEWETYLSAERKYLTSTSDHNWDEGEIRRLHLFSVVVRGAKDWHSTIARANIAPTLENVFKDIVKGNREIVTKVFATYAGQDAAAAVRLAEQVGLDMLIDHPNLLAESCQEEPFLALAIARLQTSSADLWAAVLAEAALLYSNVAYRLDFMMPPADSPLAEVKPKHKRLFRLGPVRKNSMYESILSNTIDGAGVDERLSAVQIIKGCVNRPNLHYYIYRLRVLEAVCAFFAALAIEGLVEGLLPNFVQVYLSIPLTFSAMIVGIAIYVLASGMHLLYAALFNYIKGMDEELDWYTPPKILFRFGKIGNLYLTVQAKGLAQITSLRQAEPYPLVRHLYPNRSANKS